MNTWVEAYYSHGGLEGCSEVCCDAFVHLSLHSCVRMYLIPGDLPQSSNLSNKWVQTEQMLIDHFVRLCTQVMVFTHVPTREKKTHFIATFLSGLYYRLESPQT